MWYLIFQIAFFISVSSFTSVGAHDTVSACVPGIYNNDTSGVCGGCAKALGMENGTIPDRNINASSVYGRSKVTKHAAAYGRLNFNTKGKAGAWSADTKDQNQWLQVDFGTEMVVTGVATQGRQDVSQWVTNYTLSYSQDGETFHSYQNNKTFTGNTDRRTVVKHTLPTAIMARYVRIHPRTWKYHISMRAEFYGCKKPVSSSNSTDQSSRPTAEPTAMYNDTVTEPGHSAACRQFNKDLLFIFFFIALALFQFY